MRRLLLTSGAAAVLMAGGPVYTAGLQPGRYSLTPQGASKPTGSVCVSDLLALYQVAHGSKGCRYFTAEQRANVVRVSYECADGSGILALKAVTPRAADLTASGVRGNAPYRRAMKLRRTGDCR